LTDLKKERMTLRVLSGTLDSGQRIVTGSAMSTGSGLLSLFDNEYFSLLLGKDFIAPA
jgi:hypothetical protein